MKIDLNTTKWFLDFELPPIDKLVEKIGAQLGAVDEVTDIGSKYKDIVIAKVVSCQKHPDADKLSICKIDTGSGKEVQVVCGAPNVAAGQTVVWIPPGATVPDSIGKEPFVLEAREIRGVTSNGMIASPKELAMGDSHGGILVLPDGTKPGTNFADLGRKDDFVIDIENKMFTHRPDCFGFLGVARELAGIYHKPFKSPDWYVADPDFPQPDAAELKLTVKNELTELVPRFSAVVLSDVQVGASPLWAQDYLSRVGQKSVNNIVDYTNFYMLETGQPLHAYDYDKVKALSGGEAAIVVRKPHKGEKIKLLNGKEVEPVADAVIIATVKQAIGMGGVMGGSETEVDENTKNIIIESANFDMYTTRRTAMAHGLFTDAVTRFSKGQSPLQTLAVLAKITNEIREHDGGKVAGPVIDDKHDVKPAAPVRVSAEFINARLGEKLSAADMKKLLENVEFKVEAQGDNLTVTAPFWRTDIEIPEDIVEEVGRLYGYDHLPLELPKRDLTPAVKDPLLAAKADIRSRLSQAGANEVLTYSFVHGDLLAKSGQDPKKAFQIANALSPDLQYYRLSLIPSLLEKVHPNIKAGHDEFALFEIGKTHGLEQGEDEEGLPLGFEFTGLVIAVNDKLKPSGSAYYLARRYLETLVGQPLVFKPVNEDAEKFQVVRPYALDRSAMVSLQDGTYLGIIGEFKPSVRRAFKLPEHIAGFEIDTTALQKALSGGRAYAPLSRFPGVKQDITLKVPADQTYQQVEELVRKELTTNAPDETLTDLAPIDIYQKEDGHKHFTFRLTVTGTNRTLTDKEVAGVLDNVAAAAKSKLHAERL